MKQLILDINAEISAILIMEFGMLSTTNADRLRVLNVKKYNYLAHEVTTHILKSRVLWIKEGDANHISSFMLMILP